MKTMKTRWAAVAATCLLTFTSFQASPEDIDIFAVDESNIVARPNVLFVLDNSANWSREAQQWPDGTQGQSEAFAIKAVLEDLDDSINIGLMEYITGGSASDQDSAFIRYHIRPMSGSITDATTNKGALAAQLDKIYNNINSPTEKRAQSNPFGNLFWDVYNYLGGVDHSNAGAGTPSTLADGSAYQKAYSLFQSPLTSADTCTRTVVVFIGNNVAAGPTPDSAANVAALRALAGGAESGDAAVAQIDFADYEVKTSDATDDLGYSELCYSSQAACTTDLQARDDDNNGLRDCTENGYTSCACSSAIPSLPIACPSTRWTVKGTKITSSTMTVEDNTTGPVSVSTGDIVQTCITSGTANGLNPTNCPANTDVTVDNGGGLSTRTITTWASGSCAYKETSTCSSSRSNYEKFGQRTQRVIKTQTVSSSTTETVGDSAACYNEATTCDAEDGQLNCSGYNGGCTCTAPSVTTGCAAGNTFRYMQQGTYPKTEAIQKTTFRTAPTGPFMMDEWARFLRQTGVPVPGAGGVRSQVTTYTIDVFNAQQHPDFSALLFNTARVGGGKYFQAKDQNALINALKQILTEVQAVNSAFSSASLPVNATNRAQNENQVFIGVFKPDREKDPSWFGNLKRYQLISSGATIDLGDAKGVRAINTQTGFITECAESFWTTDYAVKGVGYWKWPNTTSPLPLGTCSTNSTDDLSDLPDGPFVEKGAVAEVIRKGNDPTASPDGDGNYALNRTIYTRTATTTSGSEPPLFDTTTSGLSAEIVDYIRGHDTHNDDTDSGARSLTEPRSNLHGDVIHSRPQPLNYGGDTKVVVFYGSNDGMYRAVEAETGKELWAFVAPEHYGKLKRLEEDAPPVRFFGDTLAGATPKDYFFDGSTGVYQTFNTDGTSNTAYIYPTMRRGGRKLYAFDVSTPSKPRYMWDAGCDSTDDTTCDADYTAIGQTWPLPNVALIKGYCGSSGCTDDTTPRVPVIVMGGGYDTCDDGNTATPCAATKGRGVYVIDAVTGKRIQYFDFSTTPGARGIAADVALIDVNSDDMVDYGYAVDTGGNIYRIDFVDTSKAALPSNKWIGSRVAYTQQEKDPRKFLFPPALVQATSGIIYLAVGSGDREHPLMSHYPFGVEGDAESAILNRFYVFKDMLSDVDATTATDLDDVTLMADYSDSNSCSNASILPSSSQKGWFMDLDAYGQGEQTVTSAVVAAGFVFFSTNRPTPPLTTACSTSLGEARGYFVNLLNGAGAIGVSGACGGSKSSTFVGGGLPPSPVLATVPIKGQGLRTVVIGAVQKTGEPSSPIEAQRVRPPIASDRKPIYWYKSTGDK